MNKIKILYVAANPIDTGPLQLQEEARNLEERIRQGPHRDVLEVIHCLAARPRDLLRGLQEVQPHILHFSGHGNSDQEIVLQDDDGTSRPIAPQDLAKLISLFKTNLKLVLLSSCFGRKQAKALHQVLDFTIGMNKPISDVGAVSFSAAFYQILAAGGTVEQAFEGARVLTSMEGRPVFETSDLLIREGAEADKPFVEVLPPPPIETLTPPPRHNEDSADNSGSVGNQTTITATQSQFGPTSIVTGNNNTTDIKGH